MSAIILSIICLSCALALRGASAQRDTATRAPRSSDATSKESAVGRGPSGSWQVETATRAPRSSDATSEESAVGGGPSGSWQVETATRAPRSNDASSRVRKESAVGQAEPCLGDSSWNAGYGTCDTYSEELQGNFYWCELDTDANGVTAAQACPECGECEAGTPTEFPTVSMTGKEESDSITASSSSPATPTEAPTDGVTGCLDVNDTPWDAGWGTCDSYEEGSINYGFCSLDTDANGITADQACAQCGVCSENMMSSETFLESIIYETQNYNLFDDVVNVFALIGVASIMAFAYKRLTKKPDFQQIQEADNV